MFIAYITVTLLLSGYLGFSSVATFARFKPILVNMAPAGVPESWLPVLAALKGAGAIGLLVAAVLQLVGTTDNATLLAAKLIGTAAEAGILVYFVGAVVAHLRARFYSFGPAASFLVLTIAAIVLGLQASALA
ncbi:MAG TPA: DoxX family protein [Chloroflexota bacterium]|nr:DoxX family protein [Chloroflexota bacterium]